MDKNNILQRIVDEEGSCTWAFQYDPTDTNYICSRCPMSKLKKRDDGSYMGCLSALDVDPQITESEQDKIYKRAAMRLLANESIEDLLKEE